MFKILCTAILAVATGATGIALGRKADVAPGSNAQPADASVTPFERAGQLGDVLAQIDRLSDMKVRPLWADLETVGITPDTPVSISFTSGVSLEKALFLLMADINGQERRVDYSVSNGVVLVGTRDLVERNRRVYVDVYDARDLAWDTTTLEEGGRPVPTLSQVVMLAVDPGAWATLGNRFWHISEYERSLVITTTEENHKRIAQLLDHMRALLVQAE